MSLLRQLFEKSLPTSFGLKVDRAKIKLKGSTWQDTIDDDTPNIGETLKDVENLIKRFPGGPTFLGKSISYPVKRRRFFKVLKRQPNLTDLRDEVNRFAESKEILDPRTKIRRLLKRFPYNPDLRAINGIQIYNDSLQSGLDEKKLDVLQSSLIEIGGAIHNGGISIFNVSWFIKIYIRYLEMIKDRYNQQYNLISDQPYSELRTASENLNRSILQTTSMMSIRDKLGGLAMLNAKLKGSVYISSTVTKDEIKSACSASLQNDLSKSVGNGKTANYVILVILTLGLLLARVPMFKKLVTELLGYIPDITKDLILQKCMIRTMVGVTDFQIAISSGDVEKSRVVADRLYNRCKSIIAQYLEYSILTKPHEVDPFLKAAWIAKESSGLMRESEYRIRLEEALNFLKVITGNQGKVKGAFELARQLQNDIGFIMAEYGWSRY